MKRLAYLRILLQKNPLMPQKHQGIFYIISNRNNH